MTGSPEWVRRQPWPDFVKAEALSQIAAGDTRTRSAWYLWAEVRDLGVVP